MVSYKSKERVIDLEEQNEQSNILVERDFLQLNEYMGSSSKRVAENVDIQTENRGKNPKVGILDLSSIRVAENEEIQIKNREKVGILDLSSIRVAENVDIQTENRGKNPKVGILDLSSKRVTENEEIQAENREKKSKVGTLDLSLALPSTSRSVQLPEPSNNNTRIGYFRNGSLSSCGSHPFSHNLSYSLTLSSKEDSEYSREGLNWSVFSRCRPVEEGTLTLSSHSHGSLALGCQLQVNKDNDSDRISSSDSNSFFIFELPARPTDDSRVSRSMDGGIALQLYQPERILEEIVSESAPLIGQILQKLPDETVESTKEYLRRLIANPEKKDLLVSLQNTLNNRSDLTVETLSKCNKDHLEIFVVIKTGLGSFLSSEDHLQVTELMEIFFLERCRNISCKRVLPVDGCKCKICSKNKGFCNVCMCQLCLNLDNANGTCSWVGCDLCVHWCHVVCAIERNLIEPGPSINGPSGTTETQFHCLGCGHSTEMFRFAKEMYRCCAKDWGQEILIKELDYVQKIFHRSEDFKGKELHAITYGLRNKLEKKMISPSDACNFIFQFFKYTDGLSLFLSSSFPASIPLAAKSSFYIMSSSNERKGTITTDHPQNDAKDPSKSDKMIEDECSAIKER